MKYYLLDESTFENNNYCVYLDEIHKFKTQKQIFDEVDKINFYIKPDSPDEIVELNEMQENDECWMLISNKALKILNKFLDETVIIKDAQIRNFYTGEIFNYKVLLFNKELEALNKEKSEYYMHPDGNRFYKTLGTAVLNRDRCDENMLFMVKDIQWNGPYISEKVKNNLEKSGLKISTKKIEVV